MPCEAALGSAGQADLGIPETADNSFDLDDGDTITSVQEAHLKACASSRATMASLALDDLVHGNRRGHCACAGSTCTCWVSSRGTVGTLTSCGADPHPVAKRHTATAIEGEAIEVEPDDGTLA